MEGMGGSSRGLKGLGLMKDEEIREGMSWGEHDGEGAEGGWGARGWLEEVNGCLFVDFSF